MPDGIRFRREAELDRTSTGLVRILVGIGRLAGMLPTDFPAAGCARSRRPVPPSPRHHRNTRKHDHPGLHAHQRRLRHPGPLAPVLGGRRQLAHGAAIPTRQDGSPLFRPSAAGTAAVGTALLACAALVAFNAGLLPAIGAARWTRWAGAALALGLLVRAIGDFGYVGFFKRKGGNPSRAWTRASIRRCACCWPPARWPRPGHWPDDAARPGDARSIRYIFCDITID